MSQRFCHHVNPAGVFCGGLPAKHRDYCFWHMHETGRRMKAARARARSERVFIQLPVLDDLHAVQVGVMQLAEAIAHGEIDHQSGRLMLSVLRLAASNLKSERGWRQRGPADTIGCDADIVGEDPGFERKYGLPKGFDLSLPPEVAFPPPPQPSVVQVCAEQPETHTQGSRPGSDSHRPKPSRPQPDSRESLQVPPAATIDASTAAPQAVAADRKPPHSSAGEGSSSQAASAASE